MAFKSGGEPETGSSKRLAECVVKSSVMHAVQQWDGQINEDERCLICSTHGKNEKWVHTFSDKIRSEKAVWMT